MDDISEYERRITAALDRAAQALDKLGAGDGGDTAALKSELEAERVANQQLEERVLFLKHNLNAAAVGGAGGSGGGGDGGSGGA